MRAPCRVLKHLEKDNVPAEATWYGHMRCNWAKEEGTGDKWSDPDYTADNYPCFGGGGGNILTPNPNPNPNPNWMGEAGGTS